MLERQRRKGIEAEERGGQMGCGKRVRVREEEGKGRVERKRKASVTRNLAYLENSVSSECLKLCL